MKRTSTSLGLVIGLFAALAFGMSGAFIKPLLEAGWSPAAAVTVRALLGGIVLLPFALVALRGKWDTLWRGRWRVAAMGFIGVAATQLVYFASLQRIPVSTAASAIRRVRRHDRQNPLALRRGPRLRPPARAQFQEARTARDADLSRTPRRRSHQPAYDP